MTKVTKMTWVLTLFLFTHPGLAESPEVAQVAAKDAATATAPPADPGFAPGDTLDVSPYDFPELKDAINVAIDPQGYIRLPYVGSIKIAGMSPSQAEQAIEIALVSKGIEKQASVSIKVLTSSSLVVYLTGAVTHPAALPLFATRHTGAWQAAISRCHD